MHNIVPAILHTPRDTESCSNVVICVFSKYCIVSGNETLHIVYNLSFYHDFGP